MEDIQGGVLNLCPFISKRYKSLNILQKQVQNRQFTWNQSQKNCLRRRTNSYRRRKCRKQRIKQTNKNAILRKRLTKNLDHSNQKGYKYIHNVFIKSEATAVLYDMSPLYRVGNCSFPEFSKLTSEEKTVKLRSESEKFMENIIRMDGNDVGPLVCWNSNESSVCYLAHHLVQQKIFDSLENSARLNLSPGPGFLILAIMGNSAKNIIESVLGTSVRNMNPRDLAFINSSRLGVHSILKFDERLFVLSLKQITANKTKFLLKKLLEKCVLCGSSDYQQLLTFLNYPYFPNDFPQTQAGTDFWNSLASKGLNKLRSTPLSKVGFNISRTNDSSCFFKPQWKLLHRNNDNKIPLRVIYSCEMLEYVIKNEVKNEGCLYLAPVSLSSGSLSFTSRDDVKNIYPTSLIRAGATIIGFVTSSSGSRHDNNNMKATGIGLVSIIQLYENFGRNNLNGKILEILLEFRGITKKATMKLIFS